MMKDAIISYIQQHYGKPAVEVDGDGEVVESSVENDE